MTNVNRTNRIKNTAVSAACAIRCRFTPPQLLFKLVSEITLGTSCVLAIERRGARLLFLLPNKGMLK